MLDGLFAGQQDMLSAALRGLSTRVEAHSENLANVDTPGYKRREVDFESALQRIRRDRLNAGDLQLAGSNPRHLGVGPLSLGAFAPSEWRLASTTGRNDGNNVDIDFEMTSLAQDQITYNALTELSRRNFEGLKSVIRGS